MSYIIGWRCAMRPAGTQAILEARRLQAIKLLDQGLSPVEVSRIIGVDRRSVRRWKSSYRQKGAAAIKARPVAGRPARLDAGKRKLLNRYLLKGAMKAGFSTDLWTCPRIAKLITDQFGIIYHVDHICRLMRSLGWSPQKPERRAIERNEKLIRQWVRNDWPLIKKKPVD
jgi:transposase